MEVKWSGVVDEGRGLVFRGMRGVGEREKGVRGWRRT